MNFSESINIYLLSCKNQGKIKFAFLHSIPITSFSIYSLATYPSHSVSTHLLFDIYFRLFTLTLSPPLSPSLCPSPLSLPLPPSLSFPLSPSHILSPPLSLYYVDTDDPKGQNIMNSYIIKVWFIMFPQKKLLIDQAWTQKNF